MYGRRIHTAVGVNDVFTIGRVLDGMVAIGLGEGDKAGAVEVNAIEVDKIGVLIRIFAAGAEPDLAVLLVNTVDASDDELTCGDRVLDLAFFRINQVEMTPSAPL